MTTRARIIPALAAAVVAVAAVFIGAALFIPAVTGRHPVYTDGGGVTEPAKAPPRTILWQRPAPVVAAEGAEDEYEPKTSRDGQACFFVKGRPGQNADLFVKVRNRVGEWSEPRALGAINSTSDELDPEVSADGSLLVFSSDRPGGLGGFDLWASRRNGPGWESWSEPFNLGPAVNSPNQESGPALSPDGSQLYFASSRPRPGQPRPEGDAPWHATIRESRRGHDFDLFRAARSGDDFAGAEPLASLNTTLNEGTPAVSPGGDFLYFSSDRAGGQGGYDLYRARITREGYGQAQNLGPSINTSADELGPAVSMGGFTLDFSSNRPPEAGGGPAPAAPGVYALYHSESREVYAARTPPAWTLASLWAAAWPWLLWLLLLILLLASAWLLGATLRNRTLSILARCLLGSAIVHVMILFLLSLWGVTNSIGEFMKKPGGGAATKIRLANAASSGGGVGLAEQVRGDLVSAKAEPAPYEVMTVTPQVSNGGTRAAEAAPSPAAPESARFVTHTGPLESAAPARTIASDAPAPTPTDTSAHVAVPKAAQPESSGEQAAQSAPAAARQASGPTVGAPKGMAVGESRSLGAAAPAQGPSAAAPSIAAAAPASSHPESAAAPSAEAPAVALKTPAGGAAAPTPTTEVSAAPSTALPGKAPAAITGAGTPRTTLSPESAQAPAVGAGVANTPTLATSSVAAAPLPSATPRAAAPEAVAPTQAASLDLKTPAPAADPAARAAAVPEAEAAASVRASAAPKEGSAAAPASGTRIGATGPVESTVGRADVAPSPAAPVRTTMARTDVPSRPPGADVPETEAVTLALAIPKGDAAPTPGRAPAAAEAEATVSAPDVPGERGRAGASLPFRMAEAVAPAPAPMKPRPDSTALGAGGLSIKDPRNKPPPSPEPELPGFLATDLRIPTESAPPASPYAQRAPEVRQKILEQRGGDPRTEEAVQRSLAWLAAHQSADGHWSSQDFDENCGDCSGAATVNVDGAVTGLAVLCFLGADHTHMKDGPYRQAVSKALDWLLARQEVETGDFRHGETMYTHAIITIAMAESSGMTKDPRLTVPLTRAVRFIEKARSNQGGWRYEPGQPGDTSVMGWQVMAMVSGKRAGVTVSRASLQGATAYLDSISQHMPGVYTYQSGQPPTASMTAEGLFCRQLLGDRRDERRTTESLEFLAQSPPKWGKASTTYYWYYCTLALFQHGGAEWNAWNRQVKRELLTHQRVLGKAAGSWDPADRWSLVGGRVYQTAICTLSLEVYYRYLPMYDQTAGPGVRAAPPAPVPIPAPEGDEAGPSQN